MEQLDEDCMGDIEMGQRLEDNSLEDVVEEEDNSEVEEDRFVKFERMEDCFEEVEEDIALEIGRAHV